MACGTKHTDCRKNASSASAECLRGATMPGGSISLAEKENRSDPRVHRCTAQECGMRRALFGLLLLPLLAAAQDRDFSKLDARPNPAWARSAVVYEINVRSFSPAGNFQGVTARLDDLSKLGVNLLWLMPIHPDGQLHKKGTLGSPLRGPRLLRHRAHVRNGGRLACADRRRARARHESDHRHRGQPHRVGQRDDGPSGILQEGRRAVTSSRRSPTGPTWRGSITAARNSASI